MTAEMTDDDALLAAEYALGLLGEAEHRATEARIEGEPLFARGVEWWRERLGTFDAAPMAPPAQLWRAIETRLGVNDNARAPSHWKWATLAMSAVAATLLGLIVLRPTPVPVETQTSAPPPLAPQLLANLTGARGNVVTVTFDAGTRAAIVSPAVLRTGARDAELWVIPAGATSPVSMGVIDAKSPRVRQLDAAQAALMAAGATVAISLEPRGGSTTGAPTGPIVATGKIVRV